MKGVIVTNKGDGLYTIKLLFNTDEADANLAHMEELLATLTLEMALLVADQSTARAELNAKLTELNLALIDFASDSDAHRNRVVGLQQEATELRVAYDHTSQALAHKRGESLAIKRKKAYYESRNAALQATAQLDAWTADYSTALDPGDEVGVAAIDNAPGAYVIFPQYADAVADLGIAPPWNGARDGQLTPIWSMSAAGSFVNYALYPAFQKWMPTYRVGTVTGEPAGGLVPVVLDDSHSIVDYETGYHKVGAMPTGPNDGAVLWIEARYMTCNASVFEDGDRVLVMSVPNATAVGQMPRAYIAPNNADGEPWQVCFDPSNLRVIGFESHPKVCVGITAYSSATPYDMKFEIPLTVQAQTEVTLENWRHDAASGRCYHDESWSSSYGLVGTGSRVISFLPAHGIGDSYIGASHSITGSASGAWWCTGPKDLYYRQTESRAMDIVLDVPNFGAVVNERERITRVVDAYIDLDGGTITFKTTATYELEHRWLSMWSDPNNYVEIGYSIPQQTVESTTDTLTVSGTFFRRAVHNGNVVAESTGTATAHLGFDPDILWYDRTDVSEVLGAAACTAKTDITGTPAEIVAAGRGGDMAVNLSTYEGLRWIGGDGPPYGMERLKDQDTTTNWGFGVDRLPYESGMVPTTVSEASLIGNYNTVPDPHSNVGTRYK